MVVCKLLRHCSWVLICFLVVLTKPTAILHLPDVSASTKLLDFLSLFLSNLQTTILLTGASITPRLMSCPSIWFVHNDIHRVRFALRKNKAILKCLRVTNRLCTSSKCNASLFVNHCVMQTHPTFIHEI